MKTNALRAGLVCMVALAWSCSGPEQSEMSRAPDGEAGAGNIDGNAGSASNGGTNSGNSGTDSTGGTASAGTSQGGTGSTTGMTEGGSSSGAGSTGGTTQGGSGATGGTSSDAGSSSVGGSGSTGSGGSSAGAGSTGNAGAGSGGSTAGTGASGAGSMTGGTGGGAGCGGPPAFTGRRALTVQAAGQTRNYDVIVPAAADGSRALPVVFEFHGAGGTIDFALGNGLHLVPDAALNAIFVVPQGIPYETYGVGWNESCEGYDMPFFDAMLAYVTDNFCVAEDRVFATGFSWGADFSNALGCCRASKLRAIAAASGAEWGPEVNVNLECGADPMPAYRLTYGDGDNGYTQAQFGAVLDLFRGALGCSTTSDAAPPAPCVSFRGCDEPVITCKYAGMGHTYPPNWANETWAFFASF